MSWFAIEDICLKTDVESQNAREATDIQYLMPVQYKFYRLSNEVAFEGVEVLQTPLPANLS